MNKSTKYLIATGVTIFLMFALIPVFQFLNTTVVFYIILLLATLMGFFWYKALKSV